MSRLTEHMLPKHLGLRKVEAPKEHQNLVPRNRGGTDAEQLEVHSSLKLRRPPPLSHQIGSLHQQCVPQFLLPPLPSCNRSTISP